MMMKKTACTGSFCLLFWTVSLHTNPPLCTSNAMQNERTILLLRKENVRHYFYMSCNMNNVRVCAACKGYTPTPNKSPKIQQLYCRNMTVRCMCMCFFTQHFLDEFLLSLQLRRFFSECVVFLCFLHFSGVFFFGFGAGGGGWQNLISTYVCLKLNLPTFEFIMFALAILWIYQLQPWHAFERSNIVNTACFFSFIHFWVHVNVDSQHGKNNDGNNVKSSNYMN